ncbi:MAG: nucleotidyltransferase family protein [Roseburia sp.]|nr:nucleotidyltransferase family protein [Anaeroplasma bactoclasticum]MCM1196934.1 nucleotidyltransferase family protein [Roseburia sp.]MCM1557469.1 nucleotidyltransferase family protein [Anaeroplasma bactoclasticum]
MNHPILDMLKAYFKNETLQIEETSEDMLISKAKEQALLPFLYYVYQKKEYRSFYITATITQEKFIKLQNELTEYFNEAAINHLYVKGSVLYLLYPDPALRTRGDIDVLVDPNKINEAKELLLKKGYSFVDVECQHHIELVKNNFIVELHYALFDVYRTLDYFKAPFKIAYQVDKNLYALTDEDHFLFCIHHFANHLKKGAGLRYLLDFYYFLKKENINKTRIHELIQTFEYTQLYHNILNSIYMLTGEKLDDFEVEDVTFFLDYLVKSGIHGFAEENKIDEKGFGMKNYKLKAIFSGTFLTNKAYRLTKYPKLGKHWYTYPLCLIHRIIYLICTQTFKVFKLLFSKKNQVINEEKEFYKKLGI